MVSTKKLHFGALGTKFLYVPFFLFDGFKQRKQEELERVRSEGGNITNDLAVWVAIDTLDMLAWSPDLAYRTGEAIADVVTDIPGAVAGGVDAAVEGVSNIPEVAGDLAEGTVELASGAAGVAGDVVGGAIDLAGEVPEITGAVAEAGASFIEMLFEIIGSIFDS